MLFFQFDSADPLINFGFKKRRNLFAFPITTKSGAKTFRYTSNPVCFIGRLGCDLEGDIPNGINIRVEMTFENNKFCLMTADTAYKAKYVINSIVLHCPVAELEDSVYLSLDRTLQTKPMFMPYTRKEITTMSINKGTKTFLSDTLFSGASTLPSKVAVAFVETDAYRGDFKKNPFNMKKSFLGPDSYLSEIISQGLYLNGNLIDGFKSENPVIDFFKLSLYTGFVETGFCNGLSLSDFMGGNYIVTHDLTTAAGSGTSSLLTPGIRVGHCR